MSDDLDVYESDDDPRVWPPATGELLYGADPLCRHDVIPAIGGGIKCTKCLGWFCL